MIGDIPPICLASDSVGMEIVIQEKKGATIIDTATVVWWDANRASWVLTSKDDITAYYPQKDYKVSYKKKEQK